MKRFLYFLVLAFSLSAVFSSPVSAQVTQPPSLLTTARSGPNLPAACDPSKPLSVLYFKTGVSAGLYRCTATNTWTKFDEGTPGATELDELSDVTLTSPTNNDFIQRKAGVFVNRSVAQVKTDLSINNVDNTSDADKPISTVTQAALDAKQPLDGDLTTIAGLSPSDGDYLRRDGVNWATQTLAQLKTSLSLARSDVGLGNVDNTSDANKPVSTATQAALDLKANLAGATFSAAISVPDEAYNATSWNGNNEVATKNAIRDKIESLASGGATDLDGLSDVTLTSPTNDDIIQRKAGVFVNRSVSQFKTDLSLTKSDVGLGNVDNTADASKTFAASQTTSGTFDAARLGSGTANSTKVLLGDQTWTAPTKSLVGLGNVDNTSDANKPVSTATQTALDLKADDSAVVKLTGTQTVAGAKTFSSDVVVPDEAYDATSWNGNLEVATKNAIRDKLEAIAAGGSVTWGNITGTLSDQTDLQTALNALQASDADLTAIAGLSPTNDDIIQRKSGAWVNRSLSQLKTDLAYTTSDITEGSNLYYSDERAQDAIGTILADSSTIDFTYTDATPEITAIVKDDSITYSKLQNISATDRLLGRDTTGAGDAEEISVGGGIEFTGSGGIQTSALTGDVTKTAGGTALTIANNAVTLAKMATVGTSTILGRTTAGTGNVEALTTSQTRSLLGLVVGTDVQAWDTDLDTWATKSAPSGAVAGTTDTQTLSAKTLTAPKILDTGYIADDNGNEQIKFSTTTSAVNEITVKNSATGNAVQIQATGGDTNVSLNLVSKGSGAIQANGVTVATISGTQTLTNKTLTSPAITTPTGIVKGDVGLGNVDNTSDSTKNSATATLTNKRITPRIGTTASSSTPTPSADDHDQYNVTALAAGATFAAPTGTPVDGQKLIIRVKDNGTARTLAFNAIYRFSTDLAAPTTTVVNKTLYLGFIYNAADSKWDNVAQLNNF